MSNIQCIAEHSVDLSLINRESKVLDLGCRAFSFAIAMLEYVDKILCIDADDDIKDPGDERIGLVHGAICIEEVPKVIKFVKFGNGTGNYIYKGGKIPDGAKLDDVISLHLNEIFEFAGKPDLIKFDIEGAEVEVIMALIEAPAKQLSIEWHMHTGTSQSVIYDCYNHLYSLGYRCAFQDYSEKHGAGKNIWDSLFILQS